MESKEIRGAGEDELKAIRVQLVQIKLLLVVLLLLLLIPLLGAGPIILTALFGALGIATVFAGLRTFDALVKRKLGHDWSEARLASFLDDVNSATDSDHTDVPE